MANQENGRVAYFDYLRVFATLGVIVLHVSSASWWATDINSFEWKVLNFYTGIVRWSVPIFVMISGALFLGRDVNIRGLYRKHVLKMLVAYIVWSSIYNMFTVKAFVISLEGALTGDYHLWFLLMMAGLYICVPLLKQIAKSEYLLYYLSVSFVVMSVIPSLYTTAVDFGNDSNISFMTYITRFSNDMWLGGRIHWGFYFVLGYWIHSIARFTKRQRGLVYFLGIVGGIATVFLNMKLCVKTNSLRQDYFECFTLNVFFTSVGIFCLFRHIELKYLSRVVRWISKYCFVIFLVHALVFKLLDDWFGLSAVRFNPVLFVPALSILTFMISLAIAMIISAAPALVAYFLVKEEAGDDSKEMKENSMNAD